MGDVAALSIFGVDLDKTQSVELVDVVRRHLDGRFSIDPFGADPQLQDLIAPLVVRLVPVRAEGMHNIPLNGPALLVSNRGLGVLEPTAISVAVRKVCGRRLRIVGTPEIPIVGDALRKLGSVGNYPADLGALLRADHLAALPLGVHWLRTGVGMAPTDMLVTALGYPVIPVVVRPGGPFGLPVLPWKVTFGPPIVVGTIGDRDPLSAAELAEAAREAVHALT